MFWPKPRDVSTFLRIEESVTEGCASADGITQSRNGNRHSETNVAHIENYVNEKGNDLDNFDVLCPYPGFR